jgi:hypothetical protein
MTSDVPSMWCGSPPTKVTEFFFACVAVLHSTSYFTSSESPQPRNVKKSGLQGPPPPSSPSWGPRSWDRRAELVASERYAVRCSPFVFFLWWGLNEGCWALMGIFEGLGSELRNGADMVLGCLRK